jgi:predicted nucleotidyltransferase
VCAETFTTLQAVVWPEKLGEKPVADTQSAARQQLMEREVARFVRILTAHGNPERVIVFGSLASGQVHEWSDIDLVIVEKTDLPFWQRLRQTRRLLRPQVGTDILVYTPEEFEQLRRDRAFFREEILAKGKVVYERGS